MTTFISPGGSYEREILCAQRSIIKRIQEHDTTANHPMVLLVIGIIYEERQIPPVPGSDEEIQGIVQSELVPSALELSDGWYRIKTGPLDESLYRAVFFRKIFVGLKIKVQGAKVGPLLHISRDL